MIGIIVGIVIAFAIAAFVFHKIWEAEKDYNEDWWI